MRSGTADHGVCVPLEQQPQSTSPCSEIQSQRRIPERIDIIIGSVPAHPHSDAVTCRIILHMTGFRIPGQASRRVKTFSNRIGPTYHPHATKRPEGDTLVVHRMDRLTHTRDGTSRLVSFCSKRDVSITFIQTEITHATVLATASEGRMQRGAAELWKSSSLLYGFPMRAVEP